MKKYFKRWGPFSYFKLKKNGCITAWPYWNENSSWGWECGYEDHLRGPDRAVIKFRIRKLVILYFEKFKKGFEVHFMGFWWIR